VLRIRKIPQNDKQKIALKYFLTYGYAILIILVAAASLVYFFNAQITNNYFLISAFYIWAITFFLVATYEIKSLVGWLGIVALIISLVYSLYLQIINATITNLATLLIETNGALLAVSLTAMFGYVAISERLMPHLRLTPEMIERKYSAFQTLVLLALVGVLSSFLVLITPYNANNMNVTSLILKTVIFILIGLGIFCVLFIILALIYILRVRSKT
jgi:hypothetical protein